MSRELRLLALGTLLFLFNIVRILHAAVRQELQVSARIPPDHDIPKLHSSTSTASSAAGASNSDYRIQGFCGRQPQQRNESSSRPHPSVVKHPKFLFGIPSTLSSPIEKERRQLLRETYLSFDQQIRRLVVSEVGRTTRDGRRAENLTRQLMLPPDRVCSLQEWTCGYATLREQCQIIFAFVVGGNSSGPPSLLDEALDDFRSMLYAPPAGQATGQNRDDGPVGAEPGLVQLNIRENQFDGKMTTWFQFAGLVGREYPEIDYAVKADSDTLVFTPIFLEHLEMRHRRVLSQIYPHVGSVDDTNNHGNLTTERVYGGVKFPKTYCGKAETHHPCPLPLIGDTYMSGELNFMSMDLARFIASDACPRNNVTLPHEDVSISNYVYSYSNHSRVPPAVPSDGSDTSTTNTTIERIFIHPERILLTFNESADWESKVRGLSVDFEKRYRRFLWGHCINRPHRKDASLYTFFKQPEKVRKIWKEVLTYYYNGMYRPIIHRPPQTQESKESMSPAPKADAPTKNLGTKGKEANKTLLSNDQWKQVVQERKRHPQTKGARPAAVAVTSERDAPNTSPPFQSCAILFFGLPRSFRRYVLPSVIRNVIVPNLKYGCDYYMHYYKVDQEGSSRSGHGGTINADDVLLLKRAMDQIYNNSTLLQLAGVPANRAQQLPRISFSLDTNDTFWTKRSDLVHKYRTTKAKNGKYLYFPYKEQDYVYPGTLDNIVKQWHSIDAVWTDMANFTAKVGKYDRVAMMRNDVVYVTPIDIYDTTKYGLDFSNEYMIIPDWANWPVNDRMISGPYDAVRVWATERFAMIDKHARTAERGRGMHPERFLGRSVLPLIQRQLGYKLDQNKRICFVRVR